MREYGIGNVPARRIAGNSLPITPFQATSELETRTWNELRKIAAEFSTTRDRIAELEGQIAALQVLVSNLNQRIG